MFHVLLTFTCPKIVKLSVKCKMFDRNHKQIVQQRFLGTPRDKNMLYFLNDTFRSMPCTKSIGNCEQKR